MPESAVVGYGAANIQHGDHNIVIGRHAGSRVILGHSNILIGPNAEASENGANGELVVKFSDGSEWRCKIPIPEGCHINTGLNLGYAVTAQ